MTTVEEIRAGLAQTSVDDLDEVYAWYLKSKSLLTKDGGGSWVRDFDILETARRAERLFGQAFKSARRRGLLVEQGHRPEPGGAQALTQYIDYGEALHHMRRFAAVSDDAFEEALAKCRANKSLGRRALSAQIMEVCGGDPLNQVAQEKRKQERSRKATMRGRKTIEHMAIQLDAIARGVEVLDPSEVDRQEMHPVIDRVYGDIAVIRSFLRKVNTK